MRESLLAGIYELADVCIQTIRELEPRHRKKAESEIELIKDAAEEGLQSRDFPSPSNAVNVPGAPYDKFDILYVAFAHIAQQTFELDFENVQDGGKVAEKERLQNILNLVAPLRASGSIKVCISLGWGDHYNDIPLIEQNLSTFAPSVKAFLQANDLDGFDI